MKLFPRLLTDNDDNEYWRVKAKEDETVVKAFGRQRDKTKQLAEDLVEAWNASEPARKEQRYGLD